MQDTANYLRTKNTIARAIYSIPNIQSYVSNIIFDEDGYFRVVFKDIFIHTHIIDEIRKRVASIPGVSIGGITKTITPPVCIAVAGRIKEEIRGAFNVKHS